MQEYKQLKPFKPGLFTGLVETVVEENEKSPQRIKDFYPTNFYGVVQVLDKTNRQKLIVKFLEDGTVREVCLPNLTKGKCKNPNVQRRSSALPASHFEDKIYRNKSGSEFKILSREGSFCQVKFLKTGTEVRCRIANASKGKVLDPFHPSVYGVGYLGTNADLSIRFKKEYTLWHNMLKRAYCKEDKKGYYGRAFVDDRWHNFSNFLQDLPKLHNYDLWVKGQNGESLIKYNLDKDFSYIGCDTYSKENCQFIDESLNKGTTSKTLNARHRIEKYKKERECQK